MSVNILQSFCVICFILVFSKCLAKDLKILNEYCSGGCKTKSDAWSCEYEMEKDPKTGASVDRRECLKDGDFFNGVGGVPMYINADNLVDEVSYSENAGRSCSLRAQVNVTIPASELVNVTNATFQLRYEEYVGAGTQECITINVFRVKPTNQDLALLIECTQNISTRDLNIDVIGQTRGKVKDTYWTMPTDAKQYYQFDAVYFIQGATPSCCIEYEEGQCSSQSHWLNMPTIVLVSAVSLAGIVLLITIIMLARMCSNNKPGPNSAVDTIQPPSEIICPGSGSGSIITELLPPPEPISQCDLRRFFGRLRSSDNLSDITPLRADDNDSNFDSVSVND